MSFESFELRERFYEGQAFVFGITRKTPAQLGISGKQGNSDDAFLKASSSRSHAQDKAG